MTQRVHENKKQKKKRIYPVVKRVIDLLLSLVLLPVCLVPMLLIALIISLTSKGSPLFFQKRVGKNGKLFKICKFRTMYNDTEKDVPTHLLENPEKRLTPVGKFLRKASLDELPQLFNIFLGQMSFIGPRPALWNQDDLVELRERNGANSVTPGLSGWAQVNGRDELSIEEKAALDGEYAEKQSFLFDTKCFFLTFWSVISHKGIKEGSVTRFEGTPKICMVTTISKAFNWFVSDSAKNFADKGFEVTVMCGEMDEDFKAKHEPFAKVRPLSVKRGISLGSMLKSIREIRKVFKEENFDIIQYATPNAALCCTLAGGFKKIPVRVYGQWGLRYVGFKGIKRFIFKTIEKITCKGATHIVSTSPKNMEIAISEKLAKRDKITVIGKGGTIGVDFGIYDIGKKDEWRQSVRKEFGISEKEFVFSYIGRLNRDKGVTELISAFRELVKSESNVRLFLIGMEDGTNPVSEEILDWAKASEKVILTGSVAPSRVAQLMSATDILVHPTYREGFSMVLQEAMAMALPIITTDVPGPSEVIVNGESGILIPSHSDKAILDEMKSLMKDDDRRESYSKNARARVEKYFARPVMLSNIYNYYCKLLGVRDKQIKFMYLTSDPEAATHAQAAGVDRIFLDLEILGKEERQGHLDTVVSHSSLDDIKRVRAVVNKAQLLVRCNPVHPGIKKEIDRIINDGADLVMLPFFKTADEVKVFLDAVGRRVKTVLLFETKESVENVDEILSLEGIDEVYIGLNDLHLSYGLTFMFELLTNGTVEMLCEKFKRRGLPFGFGGIAKIGEGMVKSDVIIGEHKRLGSTAAILSRTFRNEVGNSRPIKDMRTEILLLRKREAEVEEWTEEQFEENRKTVAEKIGEVTETIRKKKMAAAK